jgi:hypothetical protein
MFVCICEDHPVMMMIIFSIIITGWFTRSIESHLIVPFVKQTTCLFPLLPHHYLCCKRRPFITIQFYDVNKYLQSKNVFIRENAMRLKMRLVVSTFVPLPHASSHFVSASVNCYLIKWWLWIIGRMKDYDNRYILPLKR